MFSGRTLLKKSLRQLGQEILYFQFGKSPFLLKWIQFGLKHPVTKPVMTIALKSTIFTHFCGGESALQADRVGQSLQKHYNITTIIDYSCEDTLDERQMDENYKTKVKLLESLRGVDSNPIKFMPLKCTSLLSFHLLERITDLLAQNPSLLNDITHPNSLTQLLTPEERISWELGYERIERICHVAINECKIGLLLDAEQSHRQPAVELLYRLLSLQFNQRRQNLSTATSTILPILYSTYQCYLTRSKEAIERDFEFSKRNDVVFGVKLVRGAYMKSESSFANQFNKQYPIYTNKSETDDNYNAMIDFLFQHLSTPSETLPPPISALFATHNRDSILHVINKMKQNGIEKNAKNIHFAQILGMTDNLTIGLAEEGYPVSKLVLFGEFDELMPWMIRRLEENQVS